MALSKQPRKKAVSAKMARASARKIMKSLKSLKTSARDLNQELLTVERTIIKNPPWPFR